MMKTKLFDPYDFSKKVIDGVPVYHKHFPTAPCVHIQICFNTGNLHDPAGKEGLSHFLEHMIFDGSPKLPDKKAIKEWSKINALNTWNAWTYFTDTNYHLKCLPEKLDLVLDGMKDMIFNPFLRAEDVEHERKVITQEAWGRYKNEKYLAYTKEMLGNMFHGTKRAGSYSPLGWPESVGKITKEDVVNWHKNNYGKGNFFIVIAGAIKEKDLVKIKKFIHNLPVAKNKKMDFGKVKIPKKVLIEKTGEEIGDPREQAEISFGRALNTRNQHNEEVQLMAGSLLQDILFERLRTERALCYSLYAGPYEQKDFLMWNIDLKVKEENKKIVIKEVWTALDDIFSGKEKKRFDVLKQTRIDRLKSYEEITGDTVSSVLGDLWKDGKITLNKTRLKERERITYGDVVRCLKLAFDKKWTVVEVITPSKK